MGKKKGGFKEPDVTVPPGDANIGKGIFEDQCSVCHAIDVHWLICRVMVKVQQLLLSMVLLVVRQEQLLLVIAKPWKVQELPGPINIFGCTSPTQENISQEIKCHLQVLLIKPQNHISSHILAIVVKLRSPSAHLAWQILPFIWITTNVLQGRSALILPIQMM